MATRQYVLDRLNAERRAAVNAYEHARVAELDAQIAQLSAGQPSNPATETTAAPGRTPSKRSRNVVRK
jgi:hypothetical protein